MFKQLLLVLLIAIVFSQEICPQKVIEACEADLATAYKDCDDAAKKKGKDQEADINCIKFMLSSRKDCWPCICDVAKKMGWKIKGCDWVVSILKAVNNIIRQ